MGEVIPFRKPNASQANPLMVPVAQYFIGLAMLGLIVITIIDSFSDKRR